MSEIKHKPGCEALGGYGQGVGPCSCGALASHTGEAEPAIAAREQPINTSWSREAGTCLNPLNTAPKANLMDPEVSALRWLLNITTEFDRKDVRTRQAARLLDDYSVDGKTNREHLESLWNKLAAASREEAPPTPAAAIPAAPSDVTGIQSRAIDLHEKASMPWHDAERLALSESGIDDHAVDELIGECGYAGLESLLTDPEELRQFTRAVLVHQPKGAMNAGNCIAGERCSCAPGSDARAVCKLWEKASFRCADCKAPLRDGWTCDACGSDSAEDIPAALTQPVPTKWKEPVSQDFLTQIQVAMVATEGQPTTVQQAEALTDEQAHSIHSMPYVRACLLEYVQRPCDEEASAIVKAIAKQIAALKGEQPVEPSGSERGEV